RRRAADAQDRRSDRRPLLQRLGRELPGRGLPRDRVAREVAGGDARFHRLPGRPPAVHRPRRGSPLPRGGPRRHALPEDAVMVGFAHGELAPLLLAAIAVVALGAVALARRRRAFSAFGGAGAALGTARPARQTPT